MSSTSGSSGNVGIGTSKQPSTSSFSTSGNVGIGTFKQPSTSGTVGSNGIVGSSGSNGSSGMPWYIKLLRKLDKDK